jgi:hypothetical protein
LDKVFGVGVKNLFTKIVLKAAAIFGIEQKSKHLAHIPQVVEEEH